MIVAVTGGAGSGKTTLCHHLAAKGAAIVDADFLGWEVLKDEMVKRKLQRAFGDEIFQGSEIDRAALAEIAFESSESLSTLNAISHPLLKKSIETEAKSLSKRHKLVLIDVALHHELNIGDIAEKTVLVRVSDAKLKKRVDRSKMKRRGFQKTVKGGDFTIDNDGSLKDLYNEADKLWEKLL